jgi:Photosynthetic reaction centre cytochrome C subunit
MMFHMRLVIAILAAALTLSAQDAKQEKSDKQSKAPAPPPTNLKILKTTSRAEVGQIMRTFTAGLGVQCNYCHVQGNNASDENPKKEIARHMIQLVQTINATFPDGKLHVSCFTCHRGEAEPKTAPEPKPAQ